MSCENCCYLIDATRVREIVGLQVDSTFTDQAGKTALDQAHELALDQWITDECTAAICDTLELEKNTPAPTPTQSIEFEKANCFHDYIQKFLAYQVLAYFLQLNPNMRIYGSGAGKRAVTEQTVFEAVQDYKSDGASGNYTAFAERYKAKANAWLDEDFSNVLFPDYTKNRDFFPCLPEPEPCKEKQSNNLQGFWIGSS